MKLPSSATELTEYLKETFRIGYDDYEHSRLEAMEVWNLYHNRQWSIDQLSLLESRGQPKETFNIIKTFSRMLVGYYSTVVNTAVALPVQYNDITMASMATDLIKAMHDRNHFITEGDKLKLSAIISGIMVCEVVPVDTGNKDQFGRPVYTIREQNIPDHEVVLDPMSTADDYSDARWLHRFKWVPEEVIRKDFGDNKLKELEENYNYLEIPEADFYYSHQGFMHGRFRVFDNYLLTHTVIEEDNGKRWSIYWCGDVILKKKEITHKHVRWNYRVVRTHTSNITEYYGIFRDVVETQKAINQAVVKLQLMANSQKIFVQNSTKGGSKNAVEDISKFTDSVNRVTGVIPVLDLNGIKVENLTREALDLYQIIDRALDRVQRVLSINDSFLGMAFASDSGRKVKLQQNSTIMALRYLTERIRLMYRLVAEDILGLANQYFTASQVIRVSDELTGQRFIELNKPMEVWTGQTDENGEPIMTTMFEQKFDPASQKPLEDDEGNLVFAPVPEDGSEINFDQLDVSIETSAYNDEDERSQLVIETVLSGMPGQMMAQVNPKGFFEISALALRTTQTRYSPEISRIFEQTAQMLSKDPQGEMAAGQSAQDIGGQRAQNGSKGGAQMQVPGRAQSGE